MAYGATVIIMLGHINVAYGSEMALIGCVSCEVMVVTGNIVLAILAALLLGALIRDVYRLYCQQIRNSLLHL